MEQMSKIQYLSKLLTAALIAEEKGDMVSVGRIILYIRCYLLRHIPFTLDGLN